MFSKEVIERLKSAKRIAVLTGAGISAESGVPTFRGENGLWKKFKPEELANFNAFMKNPKLVWEWYNYRRELISDVKPNPGHYALVKMENFLQKLWIITQNVDGLHRKAGSTNVLELHGNIMMSRCIECGQKDDHIEMKSEYELPHCECGGLMRPDVVWFGEMLPEDILDSAFRATRFCDVFFTIGTSAVVHPAASLPLVSRDYGAFVIEINSEKTVISDSVDLSIIGKSGEVLPVLIEEVWNEEI